jgi:hypothetical protein
MSGVSTIRSAHYAIPASGRARPFRLRRVELPRIVNRHFPTYSDGLSVGQQALARIQRANLASAAAVYAYRQMMPG